MHKRHKGIDVMWKVPLTRRHYCEVFIWAERASMRKALEKQRFPAEIEGFADHKNTFGACMTLPQALNLKTGRIRAGRKFAELHLLKEYIGSGYVAHEIQHLVHYWGDYKGWLPESHDEELARFAQLVTNKFWVAFYKHYKEAKSG